MSTVTVNRPSSTLTPTRRRPIAPRREPRSVELVETSRRTPSAPIRLTRRGRWVLTLLLLGAVLALSLAFGSGSVATDERGASEDTTTVVVSEGASLWSIADEIAGSGQTREVMYDIERLNGLESSTLVPGQTLIVPAG